MASKKLPKKVETVEMGGSGTTVYNGVVSDVEYNSELDTEYSGNGLMIFDRMRKSDPVIKASLRIIKMGIMQAEWTFEPASDDSKDMEIRDFVEKALLEKMNVDWKKTLEDILTYLDFGFFVGEKVFKVEGDEILLKKIALRTQKSIVKFVTEDGKDGVTQSLVGDLKKADKSGTVSIPRERMVLFTNEREGDNYRGVSILRSAYKPWYLKENIEKIDAIGFERASVGIPVFRMPMNPTPEDVSKAEELGENIRSNEKAYLILPNGWEFEITTSKYDGKAADQTIRRLNRDMLMNVLVQFLDLGSGSTGSKALSVDQSDAFYKSLQGIADYVASVFNDEVIPQLVNLNFGEVDNYPRLVATGIQETDIEKFSTGLTNLVNSQVITPDNELEDFVRSQLHLPKKSEDAITRDIIKPEKEKIDSDDDEDELEVKTASEMKKFQDLVKKNTFWRDLTFAEDKVNLPSLTKQIDLLEKEIKKELPEQLTSEVSNLLNDARLAIQSRDAKRVNDITIKFKAELRQFILDKMRSAYEIGKLSASNEMDVNAPRTYDDIIDLLTVKADSIASKVTQDLLNKVKLNTLEHIEKATPVDDATSSLQGLLTNEVIRHTGYLASNVTVGGINQGRISVFEEYPEKIYAVQRSEILDSRVCNYCLSMDGRVVQKEDILLKHGPFHHMCRGIWVEILKEETEKPEISGVPSDLREKIGTLDEFSQLSNPNPLPGSLADEFIKTK